MISLHEVDDGDHEVFDEAGTRLAVITGDHHHYLRGLHFQDVDGSMWSWSEEGHFVKVSST
jgi:hypothetical protein